MIMLGLLPHGSTCYPKVIVASLERLYDHAGIVTSRAVNHEISYIAHNREYPIIEDNNMSILLPLSLYSIHRNVWV